VYRWRKTIAAIILGALLLLVFANVITVLR
jgi:TRAP-type C4-dicarboxylate transport system permease small subunit